MKSHLLPTVSRVRWLVVFVLAAGLFGAWAITDAPLEGAAAKFRGRTPQPQKPIAPPPPRSALLTAEDWQQAPLAPIEPGEIDRLLAKEFRADKIHPTPKTTDEQFIRRATLDLTGRLPKPAEVNAFVADPDSGKRARLIDRLLDSDDYARHWAHYWCDVITARLSDPRFRFLSPSFEEWMFDQLKRNTSWGAMATAMITANGKCRFDNKEQSGPAFFLAAHRGKDADNERAAETSRVFLGIQIQCAQCHDHPSDQWKRVQFHELAGYFARLRERPVRDGKKIVGIELVSARRGEHEMPSKEDPKKGFITPPRFLDGKSPGTNLNDRQRRQALARAITDKKDYWFAAAYVNRIWGVLMGQSFYQPVDDMGPQKEAVFPAVLTRLTASFRGSNYDIKRLFRDMMYSDTYQRQIRLDEATEHLHFAASYPTRLPADALWQSLVEVLGNFALPPQAQRLKKNRPFFRGFETLFQQEFAFDPSLKADEVEGSISQALLLMNHPGINARIQARGKTVLARLLSDNPEDEDALCALYLRTLARKPTDREKEKCLAYIKKVGRRGEAFEDILWALLNSTEFQTKR